MTREKRTPKESSPARAERPKKERVIHTRVPVALDDELKRVADRLRVPVSNLVRTLLEDAVARADRAASFGRADQQLRPPAAPAELVAPVGKKAGKRSLKRDPLDGVLGFQPLTLNHDAACTRCGAALRAGEHAYLGMPDSPGHHVLICARCLP